MAADFLIGISHEQKDKLTLLTTGPLTNMALALLRDPDLSGQLERIVVMSGSAADGNVSAVAKVNSANDPEAARVVSNCGARMTTIGLDVITPPGLH